MSMPSGPCKDCKNRVAENPELGTEDCHKTCQAYKQYKEELMEYKFEVAKRQHDSKLGERPWMRRYYDKFKVVNPNHDH